MKNLFNFFFSFDKLMKEGLVRGFFWLALINLGLMFFKESLDRINLDWFAAFFGFFEFFVSFLLAIVALRLLCEMAISLFRINDNLSPDGGKSETADIDPVAEARRAAEAAAKRASEVTKTAVDKTSAATKSASDKVSGSKKSSPEKSKPAVVKPVTKPVKSGADITIEPKSTTKKAPAKPRKTRAKTTKSAPKKATSTAAPKKVTLNKDGTPRKKRGPKPKS